MSIGGDSPFVLNFTKNYINGNGFVINPNLGFPGTENNTYFPSFDFSYRVILRLAGYLTHNLAISYYAMYFVGVTLMFISSMASLRSLNVRPWLAAVGAIVYVVSPYFVSRSLNHDFLALYFSVPLGAAFALHLAVEDRQAEYKRARTYMWIVPLLIVVATSGLYYAFFSCMFALFVGAGATLARRRWGPLLRAVAATAFILPIMVWTGYGAGLVDVLAGRISQVTRDPTEQLIYGLNFGDASQVFAILPWLHKALNVYAATIPTISEGTGSFEWPGLFLTFIIFTSPLAVLISLLAPVDQTKGRGDPLIALSCACLSFGLIYAVKGGLGFYFNVFFVPTIRATTRIMPFLAFFALVIALKVAELSLDRVGGRARVLAPGLIVAGLIACMLPNIGTLGAKQRLTRANVGLQNDLASTKAMLLKKDQAGLTAILQLPHVFWPEGGVVGQFLSYSHLNAFLFDRRHSSTRWSYGSAIDQPAFAQVRQMVEQRVGSGLSPAAKIEGFDGILIEKAAYSRIGLAMVQHTVDDKLGVGCAIFNDSYRVLYALSPPSNRSLCLDPSATKEDVARPTPEWNWQETVVSFAANGNWRDYTGPGWSTSEETFVWTDGNVSELMFQFGPPPTPQTAMEFDFTVEPFLPAQIPSRTVQVLVNDEVVATWRFDKPELSTRNFVLQSNQAIGPVFITLREGESRSPRELLVSDDPRHLALAVREIHLRPISP
jgi:phosphoglycerol transferase